MGDPGFSGGRRSHRGTPTYYSAKCSWKLHKNEENLTRGVQNYLCRCATQHTLHRLYSKSLVSIWQILFFDFFSFFSLLHFPVKGKQSSESPYNKNIEFFNSLCLRFQIVWYLYERWFCWKILFREFSHHRVLVLLCWFYNRRISYNYNVPWQFMIDLWKFEFKFG